MKKVMAVGVFDLLHAGHLHYLEQAKMLGEHLTVVIAHDDTVRIRKHEPVTNHDLRCRMVEALKPVDVALVGNPPDQPMYDILNIVKPNVIALGYDQEHAEERIRNDLQERGFDEIEVWRLTFSRKGSHGRLQVSRKVLGPSKRRPAAAVQSLWRRLSSILGGMFG